MTRVAGLFSDNKLIEITNTIEIFAPVEEFYSLWFNYEQFPRFMANVYKNQCADNGYAHWLEKGPAGSSVEFDTITTEQAEIDLIARETLPGSPIKHHGWVRFASPFEDVTQVNLRRHYDPPAGVIGHALTALVGSAPRHTISSQDMRRLKTLFEQKILASNQEGEETGLLNTV